MEVELTTYAPQGTQYKFVWEKNNWADWGTIQNFSDNSTCTWMPTEAGTYNLYVDVRDATGKVQSTSTQVKLTENWSFDSITVTPTTSNVVGDQATIAVNTSGNNSSLQYKFVWEKNNWADWGTIQNFSDNSTCTWIPSQSGTYTFYVDIKDSTGKVTSKTYTYNVGTIGLNVEGSSTQEYKPGMEVELTTYAPQGTQYKFVWEKNNWADWGTIQNFSDNSTCTWMPTEADDYCFYVDIKDENGEIVTIKKGYKAWDYLGVNVSVSGQKVTFSPNMGCSKPEGFSYKYVWERDNWADWGEFDGFTTATSKSFTVNVSGRYSFYIDVKCPDGTVLTKHSTTYSINTDPYLSRISNYSSGTNYLIAVDRSAHKVAVYQGSQNNWNRQYLWSCVTGAPSTPTISGVYRTTGFKRSSLSTDSRAIYCTQIYGGYFFHSILASESELGHSLSHGCIRLPYSSALWIYNNIYVGTTVVIW